MTFIRSMFLLIFYIFSFSHLVIGQNITNLDEGPKTFIVSIQKGFKPDKIFDLKEWYKFILSNINSGSDIQFLHIYNTIFHGFSTQLTQDQANSLQKRPEVIAIFPEEIYQPHTTRTPHFLGLDSYSLPMGLLKESDLGSNVVIGILDTGIWPKSVSFNDNELGPIPSHFKGKCDGGKHFPSSLCNKKIIGARYFSSGLKASKLGFSRNEIDSAWDTNGHGTHTASTAAGRARTNASFFDYANGEAIGIAPKARLSIYKVCWEHGCATSDVLAAFDKAIEDGVDIISISLGGSPRRYNIDPIAIASFAAVEKGIVVSASAGNSGPLPGKVSNNAPWITTVGASTIDRTFPAHLNLDNGDVFIGVSLYTGKPLPQPEKYPIVHYPTLWTKAHCLPSSLNEKEAQGKIVVCLPGMFTEVEKAAAVQKAGGVGIIVTSDTSNKSETLVGRPYMIPGLTIPQKESAKLLSYILEKQINGTIIFLGTKIGGTPAPIVAPFSSRGPNGQSIYTLKPDVVAPGVNILAAWPNDVSPSRSSNDPRRSEFNILSGTSMSCPHVSGIAALLKGAHPDWTPAMIKSSLMTTAYKGYHKVKPLTLNQEYESETSLWDIGAGHVDPEQANDAGLVYDLTVEDYVSFLCASNYTEREITTIVKRSVSCSKTTHMPWDLNYPAIIVTSDHESMVTRTLTNVGSGASSYVAKVLQPEGASVVVDPMKLSFETKGSKQSFTVKVTPSKGNGTSQSMKSGLITWSNEKHNVTIHITLYKE